MDDFNDTLFHYLAYACSETRRAFDQSVGISQTRRQLLTLVAQQGEMSHAALQGHLAVDGAMITRLVKQFESEGVLNRRLDPQDNRYTLVSLTDAGQKVVTELRATHRAFQTRLLAGITRKEQEIMVRSLEHLRTNIRAIQSTSNEST